jgi:glycosyltransferase involved in cell wall biosynthesis
MESILSQTFQDFEYIIVDGSSKDATLDIIREYEPLFRGKMRYVSEPDKGIYDAMNKGFAMATGDVIGILNSDDFFTSDDVLIVLEGLTEDALHRIAEGTLRIIGRCDDR